MFGIFSSSKRQFKRMQQLESQLLSTINQYEELAGADFFQNRFPSMLAQHMRPEMKVEIVTHLTHDLKSLNNLISSEIINDDAEKTRQKIKANSAERGLRIAVGQES